MATHHGKNGVCKFGANTIGELVSWSITESIDIVDDGAIGDTAKTHLTGRTEWSGTVTVRMDRADTAQAAMTVGASAAFSFYGEGDDTGSKYKTGTATVAEVGESVSMDEVVDQTFSITGNGPLTVATVS